MEEWFDEYGCDGFNVMPPVLPVLPGDLDEFVDQAVPILQRRGLFREEYAGSTLREHLGLVRPGVGHYLPAEAGPAPRDAGSRPAGRGAKLILTKRRVRAGKMPSP
jgi:hypothetical protein